MADNDVKEILWDVLQVPSDEREALLDERCGGDDELRARVEQLVAAHSRATSIMGATPNSASALGAALDRAASSNVRPQHVDLRPGETLGPYTVVSRAGSGGFGTVYVADQAEPVQRRVALKVLHAGLDSPVAQARFEAERDALARMEHPAIARVFDAGAQDEGPPYIAMEFVPGPPLTHYCRSAALPMRDVLGLFRVVALAIQHAHEKGVVHRDLKPSNILVVEVDGVPVPKVIDFGIAKATGGALADVTLSREGQLIGTPAYMSPEQAAGKSDVDTRSDIYSLGVLLFELLSGAVPFDVETLGLTGLLQAIAREDPPRPSRLVDSAETHDGISHVPDDLDWIVLRCLEKDRARRYPSAASLAADVERYLDDLPVEAAPPSTWYRVRKLARRHRTAAAASVVVVLALVGGVIVASLGLLEARRANDELTVAKDRAVEEAELARRAEARAEEAAREARAQEATARAINDFLTQDMLAAAVPSAERGRGRNVLLREVLDVAAVGIEGAERPGGRFDGFPFVQASIRGTLGSVYSELGEHTDAIAHLRRSIDAYTIAVGADDAATHRTKSLLAHELTGLGDYDEAEQLLLPALERLRELAGEHHVATLTSIRHLGELRYAQRRNEEAYELLSTTWRETAAVRTATDRSSLTLLGLLAIVAHETGREDEADVAFRENYALRLDAFGRRHPDTLAAGVNLASFLRARRRFEEARTLLDEMLALHLDVYGLDHPRTAATLYNMGSVAVDLGRASEGEARLRESVKVYEDIYGPHHAEGLKAVAMLARSLERQGQRADAEALYRRAYDDTLELLGARHPTTNARRGDLAAFLFSDRSQRAELVQLLNENLEAKRETLGPRHPETLRAMVNLAILAKEDGRDGDAIALLDEALAGLRERMGLDHPQVLDTESTLAGTYIDIKDYERALPLARHTVTAGERVMPQDAYDLSRFRLRLGLIHDGLGQRGEARAEFERAHAALQRTRGDDDMMTAFAAGQLAEWAAEDNEGASQDE